ncbi:MAG TPA: Uma2 family endonuclease [Chloroflexota bacterium]|jgi:Uma2 family endonuclease|nr:Uma2 family endonuclease [Chloroflexota bacterium]
MVAQPLRRFDTLTDEERAFLCTFPDDTERSPWMVGKDFHRLAIEVLYYPLRRYRADWYVSSDLPILYPRPNNRLGQVAPDILVALVHNHLRDAFDVRVERGFPPFVLEVVSDESRPRDTGKTKKVRIYDLLGAQEYVIFDPRAKRRPSLSGYRRTAAGSWEEWPLDQQGKLQSAVLGLTLAQEDMLLRVEDAAGHRLPTIDEETEELDTLRAELARLRGERS